MVVAGLGPGQSQGDRLGPLEANLGVRNNPGDIRAILLNMASEPRLEDLDFSLPIPTWILQAKKPG